jgi:glycosyltransferase involved in cell wall biosynthesis
MIDKLTVPKRDYNTPLRILVEGWFNIPHSYAIVCCNELIAMQKVYKKEDLIVYIKEEEYYAPNWQQGLKYGMDKNLVVKHFEKWDGKADIDLVYRITYPYNLELRKYGKYAGRNIPTVVFYTAEFQNLDPNYFKFDSHFKFVDDNFIGNFLKNYKNFHFKTCSKWCAKGMKKYLGDTDTERDRIITLGIDPSVFFKDHSKRQVIREQYGFKETDIVLMTGGSLTRNKGIPEILAAVGLLVFKYKQTKVKLLLKGTSDLYSSRRFVESYFDDLIGCGILKKNEVEVLMKDYIRFTDATVSENLLRHLYNAVDVYVSPYLAEGFNMMVLEAIACEAKVVVSKGGSTDDFIDNIKANVRDSEHFIKTFDTTIKEISNGNKNLEVDVEKFLGKLTELNFKYQSDNYTKDLISVLHKEYSWETIAKQTYEYFESIVDGFTPQEGQAPKKKNIFNIGGLSFSATECIDFNKDIKDTIKDFIRKS